MKFTDIIKVLFLAFAIMISVSCEKEGDKTSDLTSQVTITLDVDKISLESASIRVRHDGAADQLWVYLMTEDLTSDADGLIDAKLAKDLELTGEIVVYTGQNKSINVPDLLPKVYYRFICKMIDPVTGAACGEAAELQFRTRRDPAVFEINENWSIERGERSVNYVDKVEYDNFICTSSDDETYVLVPIKENDFEFYYNNDLRSFFEDYHSSFNLSEGDSQWKNIVKSGDQTMSEQRLRSGDWLVFMIGIDVDGELSGLYQQLDMVIEPETPTKEYERWIGEWEIADKDGQRLFDVTIIPSENNMWYYMGGWESTNIFAFDTYDPTLMPELYFDKESGKLGFISQYVNTMVSGSEAVDFYFSGTFTAYGTNYVLGNELLNFMMAESVFIETQNYSQARIEANNFSTNGMEFPIQSVCYIYYNGSSPGSISLVAPTLPLTMTRK